MASKDRERYQPRLPVAEPHFRPMGLSDLREVMAIERASFTTPWSHFAFIHEIFQNQTAVYIVAVLEGRVVGYSGMWLTGGEAHITNLAVDPDLRRRGLGTMVLVEMMDRARRLGATRITLEVRESNEPAQALYRKMGFEPCGLKPGYYSDTSEDAIVMVSEDGHSETGGRNPHA